MSETEQIIINARAKLFWGHDLSDVRSYLLANGITESETEFVLRDLVSEKRQSSRKEAISHVLLGLGLIAAAAVVSYFLLNFSVLLSKSIAIFVLVGLYGLYRLYKGFSIYLSSN